MKQFLAALVLAFISPYCAAQAYPPKPVKIIVPAQPGGGTALAKERNIRLDE